MNEKLKVTKANALKAYAAADAAGKLMLEKLWPGIFKPVLITDRVKTWEDACEIKGIDPVDSLPFEEPVNDLQEATNGVFQMMIICEVLCEGWEADYSNSDQYKYTPYFKWNDSGFGFSYSDFACWAASTGVGSRLVFPTADMAKYAGEQFIGIYNKFLTKPNHGKDQSN